MDKEKYPKLYEGTEEVIKRRLDWLQQAVKAQFLCELLPEEIKALNIMSVDYHHNTLSLTIMNADGTVPTLKRLGIQGLKPQVSPYSKNEFHTEGKGKLSDGTELSIYVTRIEEPEGCKVVEKTHLKTEYVLVCEGADEEVK